MYLSYDLIVATRKENNNNTLKGSFTVNKHGTSNWPTSIAGFTKHKEESYSLIVLPNASYI